MSGKVRLVNTQGLVILQANLDLRMHYGPATLQAKLELLSWGFTAQSTH